MSLDKQTKTNALWPGNIEFKHGDKVKNYFGRTGKIIDHSVACSFTDSWNCYKIQWDDEEISVLAQDEISISA